MNLRREPLSECEILTSGKSFGKNYCVNTIVQTKPHFYEIEMGDFSYFSRKLSVLTELGIYKSNWSQVVQLFCKELGADFGVMIIFDTKGERQIILELIGNCEGVDFPANLDFNKEQVARNWLNYNLSSEKFIGNIVLCRRENESTFGAVQKHVFSHFCTFVSKILAE